MKVRSVFPTLPLSVIIFLRSFAIVTSCRAFFPQSVDTPLSKSQLDELITMLDKDGDGEIDLT